MPQGASCFPDYKLLTIFKGRGAEFSLVKKASSQGSLFGFAQFFLYCFYSTRTVFGTTEDKNSRQGKDLYFVCDRVLFVVVSMFCFVPYSPFVYVGFVCYVCFC